MILAIDVGSSTIKGGLISETGTVLCLTKQPVVFDTASWLAGLRSIVKNIKPNKNQITAVAVSGNGPTLVPAGNTGTAIGRPLAWSDYRGEKYLAEIISRAGQSVNPRYYLAKIYSLRQEQPRIYEQTRYWLPCPEFINYTLTGNAYAILYTPGAEKYLWNESVIDNLGLNPAQFPPFIRPGEVWGRVTREAARVTGIPAGLPVIACGTDFLISIIGTATLQSGRVCNRTGTSEGLNLCLDRSVTDKGLLVMPHIMPGHYNISGILTTSGKAVEWIRLNTSCRETDYSQLLDSIDSLPPSNENPFFLPFLQKNNFGPWDTAMQGTFTGLELKHTGLHLVRAVLEATGYAVRDIISDMEKHGLKIREITVSGGNSMHPVWNQMRADITGRAILQPEITDAELTGAACLAYQALGRYPNLREAAAQMVKIRQCFTPRPDVAGQYEQLYSTYKDIYNALLAVYRTKNPPV